MIDWMKPIELATDPPRPARVVALDFDDVSMPAQVEADWHGEGGNGRYWVRADGTWRDLPRVRNVATAPDLAAELAEALRTARDYVSDTAAGALVYADSGEGLMAMAKEDVARIDAALAKWDARK